MAEIAFARPEHVAAAVGAPLGQTIQGVVMLEGDEVLMLGGVYTDVDRTVVFVDAKPEGWKRKRELVRGARLLLDLARRRGLPVYAQALEGVEKAESMLEHFGFARVQDRVYGLTS